MEYNKAKEINRRLAEKYGKNLKGQPVFRIVFSDLQREKRFGKYAEYTGTIFLREFCGLREVPKYPFIKARYVLEQWIPPSLAYTREVPETSEGSYEPMWIFQGPKEEFLPPNEEVADRIIQHLRNPVLPGDRASRERTEEEDNLKKEIDQNVLELEEAGRSWIGHRIHSGESNLPKVVIK